MSNETKSGTTKGSTDSAASAMPSTVVGKENAKGFRGVEVDPTPNENYTVAGVTAGKPTPETDSGSAKAAREVTGQGLSNIESAERENKATETKRGEK